MNYLELYPLLHSTPEQLGLILNFFAGVFLSIEFIFPKSWIIRANNCIESIIFYLRGFTYGDIPLFYLISPIYVIGVSAIFYLIYHTTGWWFEKVGPSGQIGTILFNIINIMLLLGWLFLIIFTIIPLLMSICFVILRVLTISPKGLIGTIGVFFYLLGNALQIWDSYK